MGNPIKDAKYIWHMDLERIIEAAFGKAYDIQNAEYSQEVCLTFDTSESGWTYADELTIEQWLAGEENDYGITQPPLAVIGHELFVRALIPEGFYVVHIWW